MYIISIYNFLYWNIYYKNRTKYLNINFFNLFIG